MEDTKRKQDLEDEMSRFEQEIAGNLPPPPKMPRMDSQPPFMLPPPFANNKDIPFPGPPPMPPIFAAMPLDGLRQMQPPLEGMPMMPGPPMPPPGMQMPPMMVPPMMQSMVPPHIPGNPARSGNPNKRIAPPTVPLKNYDAFEIPGRAVYGGDGPSGDSKKPKEKKKTVIRVAGGTVWEDSTLLDWDPNDFRIFVGDLGNEVSDDALLRAFSKYPSLLRAKVVRDKKTKKSKGFGFVSFKDPQDYLKAMREMNGKYVGNRPVKLRKSTWRERNVNIAKKKEKEKKKLGLR